MVVVRRHLHGELAAGGKRGRQPGEERGVIVDPMKRGVREHDVERLGGRPPGDVAELEGQAVARVRRASLEHRARGVEPERRGCPGSLVQRARELAGAATEIDDASPWAGLDQIEQVEERGRSLSFELLVLSGIPGVGPQEAASMADLCRPGRPELPARGDDRNRTGVKGFAGPRVSHSATSPRRVKVSGRSPAPDVEEAARKARCPGFAGLYSGAHADVAQLARASACHAEGRGFESHHPLSGNPAWRGFLRQEALSPSPRACIASARPSNVSMRTILPSRTVITSAWRSLTSPRPPFSSAYDLRQHDDVVACVDEFLRAEAKQAPIADPLAHRGADLRKPPVAVAPAPQDPGLPRPAPLDVGRVELGHGPETALFPFGVQLADELDVFPRHGAAQYPPVEASTQACCDRCRLLHAPGG